MADGKKPISATKFFCGLAAAAGGVLIFNALKKKKINNGQQQQQWWPVNNNNINRLSQVPPAPASNNPSQPQPNQYPSPTPIKGGSFSSPYYFDDYQGAVADQFDVQFPGFAGSSLDFVPQYQKQDEVNVEEFQARYGEPQATHLANIHQPVDGFLGSYRGFEFYQPGCYPSSDTRVYAQSETVPYVPGPMASGIDSATVLQPPLSQIGPNGGDGADSATLLKPGVYPELTHADGFQDILIDAPRNLFWADNVFDQQQSLTRNFNQNYDLRGDEPIKIQPIPCGWGISQSTQVCTIILFKWNSNHFVGTL